MTPYVITKDELIEMLKPFDGHEKICINIDTKSIGEENLLEDADEDAISLENLKLSEFFVNGVTFNNASAEAGTRAAVLEVFTK